MVRLVPELIVRHSVQKQRRDEAVEQCCQRLTHITLGDQRIEHIENLESCRNVQVLYLHDNRITVAENLSFLKNLTHLYLQNNRLTEVGEEIGELVSLQKLHLGGNSIANIDGLGNLRYLQELHVQGQLLAPNQRLEFEPESLRRLGESLVILDVSANSLTTLAPFRVLRSLQQLLAGKNQIADCDDIAPIFIGEACNNLHSLDLRGNPAGKTPKYRDRVALMSPTLEVLDDKPITKTERQFLTNMYALKARRVSAARGQMQQRGGGAAAAEGTRVRARSYDSGIEGEQLMEPLPDGVDPVRDRYESRMKINQVSHRRGVGAMPRPERDDFVPARGTDRDAEKRRLQIVNEFGAALPEGKGSMQAESPVQERKHHAPQATNMFDQIAAEIEERRQFLADMRAAGKGAEYEQSINGEISQRLAELEKLHKQQSAAEGVAP